MTEATVDTDLRDRVLGIAEETLRGNWLEGERDGVPYGYSRPSPGHYPWQWYWDSCFHAIVWRRFDPRPRRERAPQPARRRIATTASSATRSSGTATSTGSAAGPTTSPRGALANTSTIQPPLLAWAWRIAVGDPADEPRIAAHHRWLRGEPRPRGRRAALARPARRVGARLLAEVRRRSGAGAPTPGRCFPLLIARNRRLGWDARRIRDAGGPVLCEVVTNVLWGLARLAAGEPSITPALVDRLWDERRGLFLDVARGNSRTRTDRPGGRRPPDPTSTWAALAPLALPDLPEEIGRRLVEEHLLDPAQLLAAVPAHLGLGARSRASSRASGRRALRRRYWRGPTWVNSAWLLWIGLLRLGYEAEATEMAKRLSAAVRRAGPARVLRALHRRGPGRQGLRLVLADRGAGGPGPVRVFFLDARIVASGGPARDRRSMDHCGKISGSIVPVIWPE